MSTQTESQFGSPGATAPVPSRYDGASSGRSAGGPTLGMHDVKQPAFGQGIIVSLLVAAAVFVLAISAIRDADDTGLPLSETTRPLFWGLAVLIVFASGIGAQFAERTAARAAAAVGRPRPVEAMETAWAVPLVATAAAVLMVATYHNTVMLVAGPAIAFVGNAGALLSRDLLDDATDSTQRTATTIHTLVIHAIAFLALSSVYLNKMTSWASAPLVGIMSGVLVLEVLERGETSKARRTFYSILAGAVMAEATIIVDWWPTHGWTGGAVLLVCFYLVAGIILAHTQRSALRPRDLLEFGAVSLVALLVLAVTA